MCLGNIGHLTLCFLHHLDSDCTSCNEFECMFQPILDMRMQCKFKWQCLQPLHKGQDHPHGVVSQSLMLDRSWAPLIAVRCAANIWRIKEPQKAPMNFCEIVNLKHTPHTWDKKGCSFQGHCHLTSHTGNGDVRGRMWQILDEASSESFKSRCKLQNASTMAIAAEPIVFPPRVGYTLYSLWQSINLNSAKTLKMITYQGVDGARLDNYMRDIIKQDIPNALHCLAWTLGVMFEWTIFLGHPISWTLGGKLDARPCSRCHQGGLHF